MSWPRSIKRLLVVTVILTTAPWSIADNLTVKPSMNEAWAGMSFKQFADTAITQACSADALRAKQAPKEVISYAWQHYLNDESQIATADPASMFKMMSATLTKLTKEQKGQFTKAYYHELLQTGKQPDEVDPSHLVLLGWALVSSGMYNQNQSFPEFAAAVAYQVSQHDRFDDCVRKLQGLPGDAASYTSAMRSYLNPFWFEQIRKTIDDNACPFYHSLYSESELAQDYSACYFFGKALGTEADRDVIRAKLIEPCGCPKLGAAKVLTWSYKRLGQLDQWKAIVDAKLKDNALPPDAKPGWLVTRGYIEEAKGYSPVGWNSLPMFKQALDTTKNQQQAIEIDRDIVERYVDLCLWDKAFALIKSF